MNLLRASDTFWHDLRYGVRTLRRNPTFAATAVLSLALGIGANAALFQLVDALLLRSLPVSKPEALVSIGWKGDPNRKGYFWSGANDFTYPLWEQIRANHAPFSGVLAWADTRFNLATAGDTRPAVGIYVSGSYFRVLGVPAAIGRTFTEQDDSPACVSAGVVLGDAFWRREYGGDPSAVGRKISLDGHPFDILGVAPPEFTGVDAGKRFDVAAPLCAEAMLGDKIPLDGRMFWWLGVMGRRAPGVSVAQASAWLDSLSPGMLEAALPHLTADDARKFVRMRLEAQSAANGTSSLRRQVKDPLLLLLGIAGLVLLIACANLANLLLARATARSREMAVRLAIGASRGRIARQLLSESLLLALAGSALGGALAQALSRYLLFSFSTGRKPLFLELGVDWRTIGFLAGLAAIACVLFGLAPALRATGEDPIAAMKAGGRGLTAARGRFGFQRTLVAAQIALSMILLTGALLFVGSFRNLMTLNPGFRKEGVLVTNFTLGPSTAKDQRQRAVSQMLDGLRGAPGISSATSAAQTPITGNYFESNIRVPSSEPGGLQQGTTNLNIVNDGYFATLGTPFLSGRDFSTHDTAAAPRVAIVDQSFAARFFHGQNPVGKMFQFDNGPDPALDCQIVGLASNAKYADLHHAFLPTIFIPASQDQNPQPEGTILVHSSLSLAATVDTVRRAILDASPGASLEFRSLPTIIDDSVRRESVLAKLSGFFGFLAVVLATVGLYGVISYLVTQRGAEIGIRLAVGAGRAHILKMVFRESALLLAAGLAIGAGLTLLSGPAVRSMLFNLRPADPAVLAMAILALTVATFLATLIPARRAAGIDPMAALRDE
jgi:putative ABC transport system permease protein